MTPTLFLWLSLSGWPTTENLEMLKQYAAELYLDKLLKGRLTAQPVPTWTEVEAERLRVLEIHLRCRDRVSDTIRLLDLAPLFNDNPTSLKYYRNKQRELRLKLVEIEAQIVELQKPVPKLPGEP